MTQCIPAISTWMPGAHQCRSNHWTWKVRRSPCRSVNKVMCRLTSSHLFTFYYHTPQGWPLDLKVYLSVANRKNRQARMSGKPRKVASFVSSGRHWKHGFTPVNRDKWITPMDSLRSPLCMCTSKCTHVNMAMFQKLANSQYLSIETMEPTRLCMCKHCVLYRLANYEIC